MRSFLIMENNLSVCLEDLDASFRKFTHAGEREDWRKINWTIWHRSISDVAKHFTALSTFVDSSKRSFSMEDLIKLLYANAALSCKGDPGKAEMNVWIIKDICKWLYRNRKKMDNPILLGLRGKRPMGGFPYFFYHTGKDIFSFT